MAGQGGRLLLSGLSGLWGYEMTPDLFIPSRVQSRLHQNCSELIRPFNDTHDPNDTTWCDWSPFDKSNYKELLGAVDNAFLVAYAIGMFIR